MRIDKMRYIGAKLRLQNIRFVWLDDRSNWAIEWIAEKGNLYDSSLVLLLVE